MSGRLGFDFGTSNTVIATWDAVTKDTNLVRVREYSTDDPGYGGVPAIPSIVSYDESGETWVGNQVLARSLGSSAATFRWMKRYIALRSPTTKQIRGRPFNYAMAGAEFVTSVLAALSADLSLSDEEIAFTVPVESFEHYEDWLVETAAAAEFRRLRLIDEASAAALGYGTHIQPGDVYVVFDFGGGTLDVSVVIIEEEEAAGPGRRCRVLGKAGAELGGSTIDSWIFQDVVEQSGYATHDPQVRRISAALLWDCERAKIALSTAESASVTGIDPDTGSLISATITRGRLEELLEERDGYRIIDKTVRRALNAATERGYGEDQVKAVLMLGGSSLVPSVQSAVRRMFDKERVQIHRPLDAVARGAAAFVAGADFFDYIQHDYAVRFVDPESGDYQFSILVKRGTHYPTAAPVRKVIKGTYDGQRQLGIAIFELGDGSLSRHGALELVFDASGAARLAPVSVDESTRRREFWMNEESPTFLTADPPATEAEPRFEVSFSVDANKRLLMTSRDLRTDSYTHRDFPVIKLT